MSLERNIGKEDEFRVSGGVVGILRNAKVRNCEMIKCETNCETQRDWFIFISRDRRISHFTISRVSQLAKLNAKSTGDDMN